MINMETAMAIGNFVLFLGTCLLIKQVIKNRNSLEGYDLIGSFLTFFGLACVLVGLIVSSQWVSIVFTSWTVSYWCLVVIFKITRRGVGGNGTA